MADGLAQLKARHFGLVLSGIFAAGWPRSEDVSPRPAWRHPQCRSLCWRHKQRRELAATMMSLGAQDYLIEPELTGPMLTRAIHNASERHLIREEHSRARHLLEVLMDNIPDGIYFKDEASQFVMVKLALASGSAWPTPIWRSASRMRTFSPRRTRRGAGGRTAHNEYRPAAGGH